MRAFTYNANPGRVLFGSGTVEKLLGEAERLELRRLLVLSTPAQAEVARKIVAPLKGIVAASFDGAMMHTPVEVTEAAMQVVEAERIDGLIAIGGGSTIGLGKAVAIRTDLPQIVIPTTYAGSEMTPILGETSQGSKTTRSSPRVLPEVVIYDVDLTLTMPRGMSGTSGINAIAHAVEALYSRESNPITSLMALEGIQALFEALPAISIDPEDDQSRSKALYGAWLCGTCLGSVGMAIHHKLCHTLGGTFDLPHAETHSIILPHALAYNAPAVPDVMGRLRTALGGEPVRLLHELGERVGAPRSLRQIGMPESGIGLAVERALSNPYWNPEPLERDGIRGLIERAWRGEAPRWEA